MPLPPKVISIFRRAVFVVIGAILLSATPSITPTAFATNCLPITGGTISDNGDGNWLLQWDALPDRTNILYLIIFATSGVGYQSWYNNGDGYAWTPGFGLSTTTTSYMISKSSLISFANTNSLQNITFKIRKDNNTDSCNPLTTLGVINFLAAPAFTLSASSATVNAGSAVTGYTINSTGGAIASYSISPAIGNGLSFSTTTGLISGTPTAQASAVTYTVTATNAAGSTTATFALTVNPDPAIAAEAARVAAAAEAARVVEAARVAAAAEYARKAKEQKELMDLFSVFPSLAALAINLGNLSISLLGQKCTNGKTVKYVYTSTKCPKGYVKKK